MSKSWEIDPETKAKLQELQKKNGNNICVDCSAPNPQWASPKFAIFMCLSCSGIHRSLGVHISFIRSVSMDSFKVAEMKRMQLGGNNAWKKFFDNHPENQLEGRTFEGSSIRERYDSLVGEEWKETLNAKVEGKGFDKDTWLKQREKQREESEARKSQVPSMQGSRSGTPVGGRSESPANLGGMQRAASGAGTPNKSQKAANEAYFARMGVENSNRPDDLPPSQGGKYGGFGSGPVEPVGGSGGDWLGDFQKDPMAGLTKGFGWLGKSAKTGYDGWVKPNVQKLAESDFARQAQTSIQTSSRAAADSFNRFVEGGEGGAHSSAAAKPPRAEFWDSFGQAPKGPDKEKQQFWDDFADIANSRTEPASGGGVGGALGEVGGTIKGMAGSVTGSGSGSNIGTSAMKNQKKDEWDDW